MMWRTMDTIPYTVVARLTTQFCNLLSPGDYLYVS